MDKCEESSSHSPLEPTSRRNTAHYLVCGPPRVIQIQTNTQYSVCQNSFLNGTDVGSYCMYCSVLSCLTQQHTGHISPQ